MSDLNFETVFGDSTIDFECPNCKKAIEISIAMVGTVVKCPHCSTEIKLEADDGFDEAINEVDQSLKGLDKSLDEFNNLFK